MWIFEEAKIGNSEDGSPVKSSIGGQIVKKEITYVPGFYKIFDEILVNACDNKQRDPKMDTIKIEIKPEENIISVWNNGKVNKSNISKKIVAQHKYSYQGFTERVKTLRELYKGGESESRRG